MAANFPLSAFKRVPFLTEIAILGPDYTGADFAMHVRNFEGDTWSPLISLADATAGTQGVSVTYDAAFIYDDAGSEAPASIIAIQIDEATLEAIALNNPTNKVLTLYYDLHVTPTGEAKRVELYGTFSIYPGVTI